MAEHKTLSFTKLHKAKFDSGLAAARPGAAEGIGDIYVSTDTHVMSICHATTAWTEYDLDDISAPFVPPNRSMCKVYESSSFSVPDATPTEIGWDFTDFDDDGAYRNGTLAEFTIPSDNVYEIQYRVALDNSTPTVWTFNVLINGTPSINDEMIVDTNFITHVVYTTKLYLPGTPDIAIQATQASGGALDIEIGSWATIQKIEN